MGSKQSHLMKVDERNGILSKIKAAIENLFRRKKKHDNTYLEMVLTQKPENIRTESSDIVLTGVPLSIKITCKDEREWILGKFKIALKSTRSSRDELLTQLIDLHAKFGGELEDKFRNDSKNNILISSSSLVASILGFIGFGLAFTTCGASLILTVASAVVGIMSCTASCVAHAKRSKAKKRMWEQIKQKTNAFNKENEKLMKILSEGEYLGFLTSGSGVPNGPIKTVKSTKAAAKVDNIVAVGFLVTQFSKPLVKGLSVVGKVLFFGSFALSLLSTGLDMYTIGKNSKKLVKREMSEQAQNHFDLANIYEQLRNSGKNFQEISM